MEGWRDGGTEGSIEENSVDVSGPGLIDLPVLGETNRETLSI